MKMNMSKLLMLMTLMLSSISSLSSNNWLTLWILMELNLFMFMPMISKNKINDQSMKYFIIQTLASNLLIFSIMMNAINLNMINNNLTIMLSLMLKIGMVPLHIWMPEIMSKMSWKECFILTTMLKIIPMIFIKKMISFKLIILPMIVSMFVASISGFNQLNLKKMMAYSSIFNLSWMINAFFLGKKMIIIFLLIYSSLNMKIMYLFNNNNLIYLNQMKNLNFLQKMHINLNLISIMGLPPMMGFFPKWMMLKLMINKSLMLSSSMILTSIISMYMYMQIMSMNMFNFTFKKKKNNLNLSKSISLINMLIIPTIFFYWIN
uniref:NADH-ubiquinone oxidoreductase chain 2 n=1 Tax=Saccharosydne procerus TaxID=871471 RepID=A0A493QP13_9HEMI|nr:NADH dehydrogenase subunit 2 [Saccharosydne procerus]AVV32034.1 NADH dehydrogenase subunit 2 [Saccharosydne procerus]